MADDQDKSQQTEQATPKKEEDARKKGQVANSREPATAIAFLVLASLAMTGAGGYIAHRLMALMQDALSGNLQITFTPNGIQQLLFRLDSDIALSVLPIVLPIMAAAIVVTVMVTGPVFSIEPLKPKLEKISLPKGIKRLFSTKTLAELIKSILKICVISIACWSTMDDLLPQTIAVIRQDSAAIAALAVSGSIDLIQMAAEIFIAIALVDVIYQRWEHAKSLRMAQKEIRDEHKESEGDPMLKGKRRQIQMEQAQKRMMADVPKADVIITNPTHIAIALVYDAKGGNAPTVVAKGKGKTAEKIRQIARQHDIIIKERKPLARSLFQSVKIGSEIPEDLYEAVAIIMAEIYSIKAGNH